MFRKNSSSRSGARRPGSVEVAAITPPFATPYSGALRADRHRSRSQTRSPRHRPTPTPVHFTRAFDVRFDIHPDRDDQRVPGIDAFEDCARGSGRRERAAQTDGSLCDSHFVFRLCPDGVRGRRCRPMTSTAVSPGGSASLDRDRAVRQSQPATDVGRGHHIRASSPDLSPGLKFVGVETDRIFHTGPVVSA